jgi:quercetin dioxygenase-like cupin family protein
VTIAAEVSNELVFGAILPEEIAWRQHPALPPGTGLAVIVENPSKREPYAIRVKVPSGTKVMPHTHREHRIYTVMSGVFYIGVGEQFDEEAVNAYPPGSVIVLPGNTWHFHWAKSGDYVTQIMAVGAEPLRAG